MDIFVEEMVEKKRGAKDIAIVFALMLLSVGLAVLLLFVLLPLAIQFAPIIFMLTAAVFYFAFIFAMHTNQEFEYTLVNTEMDIDRISNQRTRKRLTSVRLKELISFGRLDSAEYLKYSKDPAVKKIYACRERTSADNFFMVYSENTVKTLLVITPSKKITDVVEKLHPKKEVL